MQLHDWIVGGIAMIFGVVLGFGAAIDAAWLFALAKPQRMAEHLGRGRARLVIAAIGMALIFLGAAIIFGFRVEWN